MTKKYRNPFPTVDIIIEVNKERAISHKENKIVLIKRKNPPHGWALPGGFVDYGESLEQAAIREAKEETSLDVELIRQFHTYSDPSRDPRHHTLSTVYIARSKGIPKAADDAAEIGIFTANSLPEPVVFDHKSIIDDYYNSKY